MDRLADVVRADGTAKEIRVVDGHVFVCKGYCCGNVERGIPEVPLDAFKSQWKARGIRKRVHLTIAGCLGPCAVANVVLVVFKGQTIWFHSVETDEHVTAIYDYLERMLRADRYLPPDGVLASQEFIRYATDSLAVHETCV